jgi:two-component system, NarL family, sensor histidine kinase DevS
LSPRGFAQRGFGRLRWYFAPATVFASIVVLSLACSVLVIWLASAQPWLGVSLRAVEGRVEATGVENPALAPVLGLEVLAIGARGQAEIALAPEDLIEEPDGLATAAAMRAFYAKQDRLHQLLSQDFVTITYSTSGLERRIATAPKPRRPLADLPVELWTQLFVGLVGLIIGSWVVSLRRYDAASWAFLLAGAGLAMAAWSAALYSSRELALGYTTFTTASRINSIGTLLFGIGMVTLFLIYPRRIVAKAALVLPALLIGAVLGLIQLADWPRYVPLLQDAVAATMLVLLTAIALQVVVNRRDPTARAMLGWLGLSVGLGAGGFVLTAIVPTLLGQELWLAQSTAFLFFLVIYAGIAMGVARYRLFDLATWSFGILTYGLGVALMLLLDAALIYGLALDRAPALGISLALVGIFYLPLRGNISRALRGERAMPAEAYYARVTEIAHEQATARKLALLTAFWSDLFKPLSITPLQDPNTATALQDNGRALTLARVEHLPPLRLDWAANGARLFSSADLTRARAINRFIDDSLQMHDAYLQAVNAERSRINRDMHDNIGVLLLSALHSKEGSRKDHLIRQTLTDLRQIIANPDQSNWQLPDLIADLRAELTGLLEAAEIRTDWQDSGLGAIAVEPQLVHTIRSLLREGVSNIVRHSQAETARIRITSHGDRLAISLVDNGKGFDPTSAHSGNGLSNLTDRVSLSGGSVTWQSSSEGTSLSAELPLAPARVEAAQ